jgi:hypothetical protein
VIAQSKRDRALLGVLFGCSLRRGEAMELDVAHIQPREDHRAIVDLVARANISGRCPFRTGSRPPLIRGLCPPGVSEGRLFRALVGPVRPWGDVVTERVVWPVVGTAPKERRLLAIAGMNTFGTFPDMTGSRPERAHSMSAGVRSFSLLLVRSPLPKGAVADRAMMLRMSH